MDRIILRWGNFVKKKIVILAIIGLLLIGGCSFNAYVSPGNIEADKKVTVSEIQLFHEHFNNEQYLEICEKASEYLWQGQGKEATIKTFNEAHKALGKYGKVKDSRIKVIVGTPVQIRVIYISSFDSGDVTELFNFVKEGNRVKLASYKVSEGGVDLNELKEFN